MTLSAITFNVVDGGLGILPADTGNLQVTMGVCSAGTPGTLYALGRMSSIVTYLGYGPLAEAVALKMAMGAPIQYAYVLPQTNTGALSAVTKYLNLGFGVFTVADAPAAQITVICTTAGTLGTAKFTFTLGTGTASQPVTSAAGWASAYTVIGTSTSLAFTEGTGFDVGDTFTISTVGVITQTANGAGGHTGTIASQTSQPFDQYEAIVKIVSTGDFGAATFKWALDYRVASDGTDLSNYSSAIIVPTGGKYAIPNSGIYLTFAQPTILIKITTGGALGTMAFDVNVGGAGYSGSPVTSNASATTTYAVAGTNTTLTFTAAVYVLNDVWTVSSLGAITHTTGAGPGQPAQTSASFVATDYSLFLAAPPSAANSDVTTAGTALIADQTHAWSIAQVVGVPVSASAAATTESTCDSFQIAGFAAYRFFRVLAECPTLNSIVISGGVPIYDTADTDSVVAAAFASVQSVKGGVQIGAGDFDCVSPLTGRFQRRNAMWQEAGRLNISPYKQDPGKTMPGTTSGAISFCRALYRDEAATPALDAARLVTLRTYQGQPGFYISAGPTLALSTSDFSQIPNCRVMDRACQVTYSALFPYLRDDVPVSSTTGFIDEGYAQGIEAIVHGEELAALKSTGQVSNVEAAMDRTTNVISTGSTPWTVAITPVGYSYSISVTLGFINPRIANAA